MSVLLLASAAVLCAAIVCSLVVMRRSGETRVALLTGLFVLLAIQLGVTWPGAWGEPLGLDLRTGAVAAGLGIGLLGLLAVLAIGRTLHELDRAEVLHWESMEGVRGLTELAARQELPLDERLALLLELGCERVGAEIGLVSRVRGDRYEVRALHAPEDYPIAVGAVFSLAETHCARTVGGERAVAAGSRDETPWAPRAPHSSLGLESYLGAPIRVGGECVGTLVFGGRRPRAHRFSASHKDLVLLMAQWIGGELERGQLRDARRRGEPRSAAPRVLRHAEAGPPTLRLDHLVARLERRIRRALPAGIELVIERPGALAPARPPRIPIDDVVLSLVRRAAAALPEGSKLELSTADHEPPSELGEMAAVPPAPYVTLSVSESGGAVEPDALSRAFDAEGEATSGEGLPLATIYRLLQRAGGDLSVEVEPGRGSRFTLYLPRADGPAAREQAAPEPRAATPPPLH